MLTSKGPRPLPPSDTGAGKGLAGVGQEGSPGPVDAQGSLFQLGDILWGPGSDRDDAPLLAWLCFWNLPPPRGPLTEPGDNVVVSGAQPTALPSW